MEVTCKSQLKRLAIQRGDKPEVSMAPVGRVVHGQIYWSVDHTPEGDVYSAEQLAEVTRQRDKLRESNEALVAAQAHIKNIKCSVETVCEGWTIPDAVRKILESVLYATCDLTALRQHEREYGAKLLWDAIICIGEDNFASRHLKRMAAEILEGK